MGLGETIFALSSGAPPAAIAIIRISGSAAVAAAESLMGKLPSPRKAGLRRLIDPLDGSLLDEALVLLFPGPDTATGEDLVELHLHGGRAVVRGVEAALGCIAGLRMAEAGEFTRRAFANGRIDLNEAEGLADLLTAETEWQRRAAAAMAGGTFTRLVEQWRESLLQLCARVEALIDFSDEDDVGFEDYLSITNSCEQLRGAIGAHLSAPVAEKLRDGLRVVLAGPPNSGKSTLLNALVAREAAIVSDIAGTTRDVIEVPTAFEGIPFIFADTAGLRSDSGDAIEVIGIDRARRMIAEADILLWLGAEGEAPAHSHCIEIEGRIDDPAHVVKSATARRLSALTGEGVAALIGDIVALGRSLLPPPDMFALNERQHHALQSVTLFLDHASRARDLLIVAEELRQARLAFDVLTGRAGTEDMLDALFGRFCIGK